MSRRYKMSRGKSKRDFRNKSGFHPKNSSGYGAVMRGGIRL